jgi:hypothetical protein
VNDSEQPGSILVFPKFIRGTINDVGVSGQTVHAITEFEISVRCPDGATCTADQVVRMRGHWVCPGCTETSFNLKTTVNGSLYFNPEGVTAVGGVVTAQVFPNNATTTVALPPCPNGYLIVWVVDGGGNAIKFDGLIGDAIIREQSIISPPSGTARAYNAIPIQANEWLSTGERTDLDGQGDLDFNGSEYRMITGRIFGTVRYENALLPEGNVETLLTLLTLDVASNRPNPPTNVGLNFYTTNEDLVDTARSFVCWTSDRLTTINPGLTTQRMGRKGLVESTYAEQNTNAVTILGLIETREHYIGFPTAPGRDYVYSLYHDGNPVETTFKP